MGVDLRLLPFDGDIGNFAFSHTVLGCERRRNLWDKIEALPSLPVPDGFTSFTGDAPDGELGYGETLTTPYGERVQYTIISELLKLTLDPGVTDNYKNRAIWAYFAQLPSNTKVALYWH